METLRAIYDVIMPMVTFPGILITFMTIVGVVISVEYIKLQLKEKKESQKEQERAQKLDKFN